MLLISAAQDFVDLSVRVDELANAAGLDHGFDRIVTILAIACAITVTGSGFLDLSTECEQDKNHFRIVFRSDKKTAFITFEGKRTKTGCHFSHTEAFGMTTPVIGAIMNFLIFKVFFRKKANWQLIRDDMILDNRYLYDILTEGKYPERIPLDKLLTGAK